MNYTGSCHCGKVSFEVEGEIKGAITCNCSICHRKGSVLWFVPRSSMKLKADEQDITTYTFNKHLIKHRFCKTCGVQPFGEAVDPKGNHMAAINLRCVEGVDIKSLPIKEYDGRSM